MSLKKAYQCDGGGYFLAETLVQESPLEPGVYMMPPGVVEIAPPQLADHELARWSGEAWEIETIPDAPEPEPELPPPTTADDVRLESSRRMQKLVGARNAEHLSVIISNASREAIALNDQRLSYLVGETGVTDWTPAQKTRSAELRQVNTMIDAIRAASNQIEITAPDDYKDDKYWPLFTKGF